MFLARKISFACLAAVVSVGVTGHSGLANASADKRQVIGPSREGAVTGLSLEGPDVITYGDHPYVFSDSVEYIRQGRKAGADDCNFTFETTLAPGESLTEIEIAYDPATCRMLVKSGHLANDQDFTDAVPSTTGLDLSPTIVHGSGDDGAEPTGAESTQDTVSIMALRRQQAVNWSWYDEPVRWARPGGGCDVEESYSDGCLLPPVNYVRNGVSWVPDGSCAVAPGTLGFANARLYHLEVSGWTVNSNRYYEDESPPCGSDIFSKNNTVFKNGVFCPVLTSPFGVDATYTKYLPNEVRGKADGWAVFPRSLTKSGGCTSLRPPQVRE
jgi:hypothetical protein